MATSVGFKKRKPNWNDEEVKVLLRLWKDYHHRLSTEKRNQFLYEDMSKQMELYEVFRDAVDIRCKIKNLTKSFKAEKSQELVEGTPSKWRFYSSINEILGENVNLIAYVNDSSIRCDEKPVKRLKVESGQATILRLGLKQKNDDDERSDNDDDDGGGEGYLQPDESHFYNESSVNFGADNSNVVNKPAEEENIIKELYQEYKETKESLIDTDKQILVLLKNQNSLIKTQNDLCRTQNAILTTLLSKMV